jgi:hypothetical protein
LVVDETVRAKRAASFSTPQRLGYGERPLLAPTFPPTMKPTELLECTAAQLAAAIDDER